MRQPWIEHCTGLSVVAVSVAYVLAG